MQLIGLDKEIGNISSYGPGDHSNIWMRVRKWDTGSLMQIPSDF